MTQAKRFTSTSVQLAVALAVTSLPMLLFTCYLYSRSYDAEQRLIHLDTQIMARTLARRLELFTNNRILALRLTSAFYESSEFIDDNEFARYSSQLQGNFQEFCCITYLDSGGTARQMFPGMGGMAEANKQLRLADLYASVQEVLRQGAVRVISDTPLFSGKRGVAILSPIHKNGKVVGLVMGGIAMPDGLEKVFGKEVRNYWQFTIFDEKGRKVAGSDGVDAGQEAAYGIKAASEPFAFGEWQWRLLIRPRPALYEALRTSSPEKILLFGGGTTVLVICTVYVLFRRQGQIRRALEDSRQAHAVVSESERRFREVMERVRLLGIVLDSEGRLLFCNDRFLQTTGYSREEAIGKDLFELCAPQGERETYRLLHHDVVAGREDLFTGQMNLLTRKGEVRRVAWNHVVSYDSEGNVEAVTALGDDITERLANEEALRQSQKLESLGVLAGGIAHDFNNLLTTIIGHNDLAIKKAGANSPLKSHLDNIGRTARRLADLTGQMLAYSGRGRIAAKETDINVLIREMSDLMSISIPKRVEIFHDLGDNLPRMQADVTQIEQVLLNLVTNAAESIPERPGKIIIKTRLRELTGEDLVWLFKGQKIQPGSFIELSVRDDGCGIEPEQLPHIFDPFYTTKFTGRGLGLAVLQGIVRGHGGAVAVESQVGKGTTFRIYFPAKADAGGVAESDGRDLRTGDARNGVSAVEKKIGKGTVLIVDDEPSVRHLASEILKLAGFQTLEAPDGETGIEIFRQRSGEIVAILLDLMMPGMGGQAACVELREIDPNARIIIISGYSNAEIVRRFQEEHLVGFVQKPFLPSELLQWVFEAVEPTEPET